MNEILKIKNLKKSFHGKKAVENVSIEIEKGKITGLIGPNGAGKTTLFNLITGVYSADEGSIQFEETELTDKKPYEITNLGLVRTFQITRSLNRMKVLENLLLAPKKQTGESFIWSLINPWKVKKEEEKNKKQAMDILEFFDLDSHKNEYAGSLSGGQKKLLELARALMTDPELVLLDEVFAGVNPTLSKKLIKHIEHLKDEHDITFLLIEHDIPLIMEVCDEIKVMANGEIIAEGEPEAIKNNQKVLDAYLGVVHE